MSKNITVNEAKELFNLDPETVRTFSAASSHVLPRVYQAGGRFDRFPHQSMYDFSISYYIDLGETDDGSGHATIPVTDELLDRWSVSIDDVHAAAVANLSGHPVPLADILGLPRDLVPLFYLSNVSRLYGAALILSNDILEDAADLFGGSFVVLPSSIHEVLTVPVDLMPAGATYAEMRDIVRAINGNECAPDDVLSDNVYLYTPGEGLQVIAA